MKNDTHRQINTFLSVHKFYKSCWIELNLKDPNRKIVAAACQKILLPFQTIYLIIMAKRLVYFLKYLKLFAFNDSQENISIYTSHCKVVLIWGQFAKCYSWDGLFKVKLIDRLLVGNRVELDCFVSAPSDDQVLAQMKAQASDCPQVSLVTEQKIKVTWVNR